MTDSRTPAERSGTAFEFEVRRLQTKILYDQLPQGLIATAINAAALAFIQSAKVEAWIAWGWFAAIAVVTLARAGLYLARRRLHSRSDLEPMWQRAFMIGVVASGTMWGATALLLFPTDSITHQAFMGFVLAGMSAGAVGSFAASHGIFLAFMLPTCMPYTIQLFLHGETIQIAMGVMTVAFIATTWMTSKKTNATTTEALRLRFQNIDLVQRFENANANLRQEIVDRERAQQRLVKLMEQAEAATRAKSLFVANMSHEIRTPMNGVIGMADILSRSNLSQRQRHQLSLIQNSARTLLSLLNDILDFSRIESGRIELESAPFDLREIVGDAADTLAEQAQSKGIEFAYEIGTGVAPMVIGDQFRLRQVLINLLGNAVKFTESGSVVLRLTHCPATSDGRSQIRFAVTDSGIGIAPQIRKSLFDPFTQADPSMTRRFGGSGLGLSISHHLVSLMGGRLDCTSVPGEGSEFFFSLPFEPAGSDLATSTRTTRLLSHCRVLVVDESPVALEIVSNYLRSWKLEVALARNGADVMRRLALAAGEGRPYAIVVASAALSDMSGIELASRIRAERSTRAIRLVLLTPLNWSGDLQLPEFFGKVTTVTKPVRPSMLFNALATALNGETPTTAAQPYDVQVTSASAPPAITFSAHVLLVEDNPVNQAVATEYLRGFGCTLDVADNGLEALQATESNSYDLIFMDCQMPVLDGYEAARRLRTREHLEQIARTPIVALTAGAFAGDKEQCLKAGMDDYISKPFAPEDISASLCRWLAPDRQLAAPASPGSAEGKSTERQDPEPLDRKLIASLSAKRPALLKRLVPIYLEHATPIIEKLAAALDQGDMVGTKLLAHALKSSSGNVGATNLAELCQLLEVSASKPDVERARANFSELIVEFGRVEAALIETREQLLSRATG